MPGRSGSAVGSADPTQPTADKIKSGGQAPQPVDPHTIPVDTAITLDKTFYQGAGLDGAYRAIQGEFDYGAGHKVSSGIERIDATHVRINVGDSHVVDQANTVGIGDDDGNVLLGSSNSHRDEKGKLASVDLDISTKEGWAAYQRFLGTGRMPDHGSNGTSNETYSDFSGYQGGGALGAKIKGFGISWTTDDVSGVWATTHYADGSTSLSWVARMTDDVTVKRTAEKGVDGKTANKDFTFQLKNANGSFLRSVIGDSGGDTSGIGDGDQDATIDFTPQQLRGYSTRPSSSSRTERTGSVRPAASTSRPP